MIGRTDLWTAASQQSPGLLESSHCGQRHMLDFHTRLILHPCAPPPAGSTSSSVSRRGSWKSLSSSVWLRRHAPQKPVPQARGCCINRAVSRIPSRAPVSCRHPRRPGLRCSHGAASVFRKAQSSETCVQVAHFQCQPGTGHWLRGWETGL